MRIHVVKRDNWPLWKKAIAYVSAVFAALLVGAVILLVIDVNPIDYYYRLFTMGMVGNKNAYRILMNFLKEFVPLTLTSVGLSLAFKMKFWNIGGEGQFIMGSIAATAVAIKLGPAMPMWLTLVVMCVAAMLISGLYGLVAGFLKVKFGTNETLMTLMLNYVALYFLDFIGNNKEWNNFFLQESSQRPVFVDFSKLASFPGIKIGSKFELNICVIFTIVVCVLVFIYLKYTKRGYEISVVGDSVGTAKYAGMKVNRIILRTVFLSAALIGLASAFRVGTSGALSNSITNDVGWTGIIVAWLSQLNTGVIFVVSSLITVLQYGSEIAASNYGAVDSSFANILQSVILFLVLAADFFIRFRFVIIKKGDKNNG